MADQPVMTGLVLAGGASTRMGRDKATLVVDGERLVDRAVRLLGEVCNSVFVAARNRAMEVAGARLIDDADGEGPLAGIVAGLRTADTPLLAVLAVDMPHASPDVFRALAAQWSGEAGVAPVVEGVVQPLHAVYATADAERFAALLAAGERSPRRALAALNGRVLDMPSADASFADNLNRPEDLHRRPAAPTESR